MTITSAASARVTITASHAAALPTVWPMCIAHSPSLLHGIAQFVFLNIR
ncbi:hypothetical protein LGN17_27555 [Burkholderia sp. AU30280]|nr:hypothetical protein [Burkholderia sp. AU30280]MCA8276244.1 hypothetical protein [Burkholderia sp. AU30280]